MSTAALTIVSDLLVSTPLMRCHCMRVR
jgi:hypothetical protein